MRKGITETPFLCAHIILLLVTNASICNGVNAFSSSSHAHSNDLVCASSTSTARCLYRDSHHGPLGPVYSSASATLPPAKTERKSKLEEDIHREAATHETSPDLPLRRIFHGFTSVFRRGGSIVRPDIETQRIEDNLLDEEYEEEYDQVQVASLVDITWLKAHEQIVSEERVQGLYESTLDWGAYRLPLLVDSTTGAILDGHHRYAVGRLLGLSKLPVILVDYLNDDTIGVDVWPECGIDCLTKEEVIEMSLSDEVYPPKTSKHEFVSCLPSINVPLWSLR